MFKLTTTSSGPVDKLMIGGEPYRLHFIILEKADQVAIPGLVGGKHGSLVGNTLVRELVFDTEENAQAAMALINSDSLFPDDCYTSKTEFLAYQTANGISHTAAITPA
jgi:hypothetical protein